MPSTRQPAVASSLRPTLSARMCAHLSSGASLMRRCRQPMPTDRKRDYEVGYGKPPVHTRFRKGQSGNPRGRPRGSKNLTTLVSDALDQLVVVTENGRRRKIAKRELGIAQLVNKFAMADPHATRILLGLLQEIERRAPPASAERPTFAAADTKVIENLLDRLRSSQ